MNIKIRKANICDKDILNNLFQKLLEYERDTFKLNINDNLNINSYFDKRLQDKENHIILVACLNEDVIGYIYAYIDFDNKIARDLEAIGGSFFILEDYRYQKIGSKLMNELMNELKLKKVKYFSLDNIYANEVARKLYSKLGFEVIKENRVKELL